MLTGTHVLVAVEDTPGSRLAVEEALSLGMCCVTLERMTFVAVARRESGLEGARSMVEAVCARGREKWPRLQFEAVAAVGHPSNIIVRAAEERNVDMIMIGGMGDSPLPRMFTGRVTKEVCGWAHCAVLVVSA
jgi:nucleotide-binding universal stress UspA family protein